MRSVGMLTVRSQWKYTNNYCNDHCGHFPRCTSLFAGAFLDLSAVLQCRLWTSALRKEPRYDAQRKPETQALLILGIPI